jgi:FlaA1/EpsC-like NDP-sugar epimerase
MNGSARLHIDELISSVPHPGTRTWARSASIPAAVAPRAASGSDRPGPSAKDRGGVTLARLALTYRRAFVVGLHLLLVIASNYFAFWLRFDGTIPADELVRLTQTLAWLVVIRGVIFIPFRLYSGLWRYTGITELCNILMAVVSSTTAFYLVQHWGLRLTGYSRSVFLIDSIVLMALLSGIRLSKRIVGRLRRTKGHKRVLIFGAGDAGEMIVRDMKNRSCGYEPLGFIDDNPAKIGQRIHGVPVLGSRYDLARILAAEEPHEVLVAIPSADPSMARGVVELLQPFKVPITTLPSVRDILDGRVAVNQIRELTIDDLLPRAAIDLSLESVRQLIAGKRVLVTGAGGSIGSELSRQIAALKPASLVLFERYENSLYDVTNDLVDGAGGETIRPVIGDVTDVQRVSQVLEQHRPQIIFHAAAHKHVPMMEHNPCEAVKNNIVGTATMANAAERYGVERFIMISTDKAVNPSSVMGATKRVGELILQVMSGRSATRFATVRFGNVLGSNGSVIPRFCDQIKAGGPVTVTHPEIRRYFMLIPEAAQLVLHAAVLGEPGTVYVLDMGEQIKIVEMARNVIRLAGFVPEQDIPITFIGLRPGEKLFEELIGTGETSEPSSFSKIMRVRGGAVDDSQLLESQVAELVSIAGRGDAVEVVRQLRKILPTFVPPGAEEQPAAAIPDVPVLVHRVAAEHHASRRRLAAARKLPMRSPSAASQHSDVAELSGADAVRARAAIPDGHDLLQRYPPASGRHVRRRA